MSSHSIKATTYGHANISALFISAFPLLYIVLSEASFQLANDNIQLAFRIFELYQNKENNIKKQAHLLH